MKRCINLSTVILLLTMASGCSKFRELTRRDYALLRDPFVDKTEDAESQPPGDAVPSTSGYVKIDDTASETAPAVKADYKTVAQTKEAADPDSTGFQGIRVRGMGKAISTELGTTTPSRNSSSTTMAEIDRLLKEQSDAVSKAQPVANTVGDFSKWALSEKERWNASATAIDEKAMPLLNPITQVSKTVKHAAAGASLKTEKASPWIVDGDKPPQPQIKSPAAPPVALRQRLKRKAAAKPTSPPPVGDTNPFAGLEVKPPAATAAAVPTPNFDEFKPDQPFTAAPPKAEPRKERNPFAAFEKAAPKPEVSKSSTPKAPASLDAAFNFDTGWRPSETESP